MRYTSPGSLANPDGTTKPLEIDWAYTSHQPFSIFATFRIDGEATTWEFSRDVIAAALGDYEIHGEGDVTFCRLAPNTLMVRIDVDYHPDPVLIVTTDTAPADLLAASFALVPAGCESVDVDGALARILTEGSQA